MERILSKTLLGGKFENLTRVRSRIISAIPGRGNRSTEARFRSLLVREGFRGGICIQKKCEDAPTFSSPQIAWRYLLMVAFGTAAEDAATFPETIQSFGRQRSNATDAATGSLPGAFKVTGSACYASGNTT